MAEIAEQDFSNFYLTDIAQSAEGVHELAGGVIPEIAEHLAIDLGSEPNSDALGRLVGAIGKNKVLRDNEDVTAIDRDTAVGLVERSGVQKQLHRSLWTPDMPADDLDAVVMTGAVANWMDRAALHIQDVVPPQTRVLMAMGNRVMDSGTEKANPHIVDYREKMSKDPDTPEYPTESEYAIRYVGQRLLPERHPVVDCYPFAGGPDIAAEFFRDGRNSYLFYSRVGFARVANAGIQLAVQMRTAAREIDPSFDSDHENPQVFVLTDTFDLARTEEEEAQPQSYQKAITALRQVALTAKMLHEAAGGE